MRRWSAGLAVAVATALVTTTGCSSDGTATGSQPSPSTHRTPGPPSPSAEATGADATDLAASVLEVPSVPALRRRQVVDSRTGRSVVYSVTRLDASPTETVLTLTARTAPGSDPMVPSVFSGVEVAYTHDLHGVALLDRAGNLRVTPLRYLVNPDRPSLACACRSEAVVDERPQSWTAVLPPLSAGARTVDVALPDDDGTGALGPVRTGAVIPDVPVQRD